jgi:hypothetical protein
MKKIVATLILTITAFCCNAQAKLDDFGRIVLNTYLPEKLAIPAEARDLLITKLNQIASNNGMGGSQVNPRFIITANVNVGTKDLIAGPPQMIAQNVDVTLFVGDAVTNTIFANTTLSLKGVGTNENKAFIEAFKTINSSSKEVSAFLEKGKIKIIDYYNSQCDFILTDAKNLNKQEKFDEALYILSLVPQVCESCYSKTSDLIASTYQSKIDTDCSKKMFQAKTIWSGNQNIQTAENAINILMEVNPNATSFAEVNTFANEISQKLAADEKQRYELALKKYNDKIQLEKSRIDSYKTVAVEYAKNQPKTIAYNNIYWR